MDSFENHVVCFLPDNPERELTGNLVFSNKELKLDIVGDLRDRQSVEEMLDRNIRYPVINGWLVEKSGRSEAITLCECRQKPKFSTGVQTTTIDARYLIKGYHFPSLEGIKLEGLIVRYTNLEKWVNMLNVTIESTQHPEKPCIFTATNIHQELFEPINIGELNECSISIIDIQWFDANSLQLARLLGADTSKITLEGRKKIQVKPNRPRDFRELLKVVYEIQEFLTFACGQLVLPYSIETEIRGQSRQFDILDILRFRGEAESRISQGETIESIRPPQLVDRPYRYQLKILFPTNVDNQTFDSRKILFRFTDIGNNPSHILQRWDEIREDLELVIQAYLRSHYIPVRHPHENFLSLAQAVEGFHRIYHNHRGEYCNKSKFEKIRKALKETFQAKLKELDIDEAYWDSLLKKPNYWNEFSLKERLDHLFSQDNFTDCLPKSLFPDGFDFNEFNRRVRDVRNNLTHINSGRGIDYREPHNLATKLKVILEVCLLRALEFELSDIRMIMDKYYL